MHVVIFEPCPGGHRFTYVRRIITALSELPVRISLATSPGASARETFSEQLRHLAPRFQLDESYPESDPTKKIAFSRETAAAAVRAARSLRPDHLIIPSGDGVLQMLGLEHLLLRAGPLRDTELEAMILGASWVYHPRGNPRRWAKRRAWAALTGASKVRTLHIIDPLLRRAFKALTPGIARRTVLVPDPVDALSDLSKVEARRRLNLDPSGRIVSSVGRLDERKGVDLLIRAFLAAGLPPTDRLLLVGIQMPEIRELLAGEAAPFVRTGRIIALDGYVTDEQMSLAIAAADLIGVPYRRHLGSASIVIRAAAQGRPILGTDMGWPGETCRRFGLGTVCTVRDPHALTAALRDALDAAPSFTPHPASRRFVQFHSVQNAHRCWAGRLRQRLNLPDPVPALDWDWVLETAIQIPDPPP